MMYDSPALILVLADQLSHGDGALRSAVPGKDAVVMAEVSSEATYTLHNKHKIAFLFSAMRHFRDELRSRGFSVYYFEYEQGIGTLREAAELALAQGVFSVLRCCKPGEHRVYADMQQWELDVAFEWVEDDRFLCSQQEFELWAQGRKQLRMEYFYRQMRKKYSILLNEDGLPEGGKWNFDADNRKGWRSQVAIPSRPETDIDSITVDVIAMVEREFSDHPGQLDLFYLGVTASEAEARFEWFLAEGLKDFGTYQDALAEESPWLFHGLISMYLNAGLLDPLSVCRRTESAWRNGQVELSAAEGFIRQVLGWREFVRGIYWLKMPEYASLNTLDATRPLPDWFWTGETELRCLENALKQSLNLGYAHHIQRLMVIGNFALLTGLDVRAVCDWYLGVYVDAYEWVELPNTLGMALHADGGLMASKPYAASGKYIERQGNHCRQCRYDPKRATGEGACPYNSLYWGFVERNLEALEKNPRMNLTVRNWHRKDKSVRDSILHWSNREVERLAPLG